MSLHVTGYRQLDRFFIYLVPLCSDDSEMSLLFKCMGLSSLTTMLLCNDNTPLHFSSVLPAILINLPKDFVLSKFSDIDLIDTDIVKPKSINDCEKLSVLCLRLAAKWVTSDTLSLFSEFIFRYLDTLNWPTSTSLSILLLLSESAKLRFADSLIKLTLEHISNMRIPENEINDVTIELQGHILSILTGFIQQVKCNLGPWQVSVQLLLSKLKDDSKNQINIIHCIGAHVLKLDSLASLWDIQKLVLTGILFSSSSQANSSFLKCALYISKLHKSNEGGIKISDVLLHEYIRISEFLPTEHIGLLAECLCYLIAPVSYTVGLDMDSCVHTFESKIIDLLSRWFDKLSPTIAHAAVLTQCAELNVISESVFDYFYGLSIQQRSSFRSLITNLLQRTSPSLEYTTILYKLTCIACILDHQEIPYYIRTLYRVNVAKSILAADSLLLFVLNYVSATLSHLKDYNLFAETLSKFAQDYISVFSFGKQSLCFSNQGLLVVAKTESEGFHLNKPPNFALLVDIFGPAFKIVTSAWFFECDTDSLDEKEPENDIIVVPIPNIGTPMVKPTESDILLSKESLLKLVELNHGHDIVLSDIKLNDSIVESEPSIKDLLPITAASLVSPTRVSKIGVVGTLSVIRENGPSSNKLEKLVKSKVKKEAISVNVSRVDIFPSIDSLNLPYLSN